VKNGRLREFVEGKLYDGQSPLNISSRIRKYEKHLPAVSKDSIYRYVKSVYGRKIEACREKRKASGRKKRRDVKENLKDRTFIDKRPGYIAKRERIGDAEADFIVSGKNGKGIILNVTDRRSRAPFLEQIIIATVENVHAAFKKIKKRFPELRTITADNDLLFRSHKRLEKLLGIKIYFCHPYHSWEKGTVENANGYVRRDIPKGSDISKYSKQFIRSIERKLQRRYMGCLKYLTPYEAVMNHRKQKSAGALKKVRS